MRIAVFCVAGLLSTALAACGAKSSPIDDAREQDIAADATLENPLPFKSIVEPGGWSVKLGETDFDAGEEITAGGSKFVEPKAGRQYVTVDVTATNLQPSSKMLREDVAFGFSSRDGERYGDTDADRCPKLPNALEDRGEASGFDEVVGEVCVSVPSKHVDGGMWVVTDVSRPEDAFHIETRLSAHRYRFTIRREALWGTGR